ncbi:beta-1,4-glucuronyltransferase 1-like isoform X1 [Styela clava]
MKRRQEVLLYSGLIIFATIYLTRHNVKFTMERMFNWEQVKTPPQNEFHIEPDFKEFVVDVDNTHTFGIIRNAYTSDEIPKNHDVTLVTHMDASRLQNVINLAENFLGPIHVCIFVTSVKLLNETSEILTFIRKNFEATRMHVVWSILYPLGDFGMKDQRYSPYFKTIKDRIKLSTKSANISAKQFGSVLKILGENNAKLGLSGSTPEHISFYPHTIAMNVALNSSTTDYFLCIDSDLTPSKGMRNKFIKFAESLNLYGAEKSHLPLSKMSVPKYQKRNFSCLNHVNGKKSPPDLYVVPAFQSNDKILPRTVKELRQSVLSGRSTYFFSGMYEVGYGPTNHTKWLSSSNDDEESPTTCLYKVKYLPGYEPFIVARKGIPIYDERFSGYSPVENHHKRLLNALGYRYVVLSNAFLVHRGWKVKGYRTKQKGKEMKAHETAWKEFLQDMRKIRAINRNLKENK